MNNNELINEYNQMYNDFFEGKITDKEWYDYCLKILDKIMNENVEVFKRLKER